MKKALSWILALTLVFACVFAFASCTSFKGDYKDTNGSVWHFTGSKLKIDTKLPIDKATHDIVAVYSYDYEVKEDKTEVLTVVLEKYKYSGSDDAVKQTVKEMNRLLDLQTETKRTTEYTVTMDKDGALSLKKGTTTTKLTSVR